MANWIILAYKDMPEQFEEDFGFPMGGVEDPYGTRSAFRRLVVDLFVYVNGASCAQHLNNKLGADIYQGHGGCKYDASVTWVNNRTGEKVSTGFFGKQGRDPNGGLVKLDQRSDCECSVESKGYPSHSVG